MSPSRIVQWNHLGWVAIYGDADHEGELPTVIGIARGTFLVLRPLGGQFLELGRDLLRRVTGLFGARASLDFQPPAPVDIGGGHERLDWAPWVQVKDSLVQYVRWSEQNRDWARDIRND